MVRHAPRVRSLATLSLLLATAFGQRRKMLRGHLLPWLRDRGVEPTGIAPTQRAEEVPPDVWYALADAIDAQAAQ